ncbi:beta-lactamase/transpeptidase-like protein [Mycena rebaudengoi]|nr:beta-lactamase/transpeptidase-like protein [Mycena rebaudengoi]
MPSRSLLSLSFSCLATASVALGFDSHQSLSISTILTPKIDAAIADILRAFQVPGGVAVAVIQKDAHGSSVLESKGYGNASSDGHKKVTADTLFAIGSNSKLMDPVATSESTIVDLMSHRTGLPWHDLMVPISASVPEVNYVHENILKLLGMDHTTYFYADAIKTGNLADSFARDRPNVTENPFAQGISGPGGVISSAHDMVLSHLLYKNSVYLPSQAIWLQMLLREGKNQLNKTVIPSEVIREVTTGVSVLQPVAEYPELSPVVYGGGQMRGTYRGHELMAVLVLKHDGGTPGTAHPSPWDSFMESVKYRILDSFFRLEPIDWTARQVILASHVTFLINGFRYRAAAEEARDANPATGSLPTILPGVIDHDVPTLITRGVGGSGKMFFCGGAARGKHNMLHERAGRASRRTSSSLKVATDDEQREHHVKWLSR